ncbi:MAG: hypothetical protein D6770_06950 [Anaerolineae bacterium]|nr:MAG: hypothetical protein D6770_06950 [Anaerolineae bacterium]
MPGVAYDIIELLGALFRLIGLLVFGLGMGWFSLEAYRKSDWRLQIAVFLGFVGLSIGLSHFLEGAPGGFGAYTLGVGAALLLWGRSEQEKEEEKSKE